MDRFLRSAAALDQRDTGFADAGDALVGLDKHDDVPLVPSCAWCHPIRILVRNRHHLAGGCSNKQKEAHAAAATESLFI